ncbi:uncharacterized protein SRS1_12717 [Sporisorium reilianum f. sp. reilianum]|uniref:C3H1-type domain-containing protein n=1 Tax=Sporisorium reilianum f. sp. reilianum TaxID=72559 RepID=A0A2N8UBM7_9BASI|nr:uncharacterized protein SRS1_12717 [Sporisorium reilianum f. sp. reilianum]
MSPYSNSFQPVQNNAKPVSFPLPRPHLFPPLQERHNSAPAKSGLNILDVTDIWREDVRRASQRLDEQINQLSQLKLSDPVPLAQPHSFFAQSRPESGLGRDKTWPWMEEIPNLSSSPVSDISSANTTRASQSPDAFTPFEPQAWPSFPSWDMNVAASSLPNDTQTFIAPHGRFSPDSLHGSTTVSTSSHGSLHTQDLFLKQQQQGLDFVNHTRPVAPHQVSTSFGAVRTHFDPFAPAGPSPQAAVGSGVAPKAVPIQNGFNLLPASLSPWSITQPNSPPQSSFFPGNAAVVQPTLAPSNIAHGKKASPNEPAPFNRKSELYKTEMCRNWEEKGYCFYKDRCQFAHGPSELRPVVRDPRWKTKPCKRFRL